MPFAATRRTHQPFHASNENLQRLYDESDRKLLEHAVQCMLSRKSRIEAELGGSDFSTSKNNKLPSTKMKMFHKIIATSILTALCTIVANAADLTTTQPVPAKTNGENWWRGNCERIAADIKKMEGKIDIAFVGDSITARWRGSETWTKHWGSYRAVNMGIGGDRTQNVLWRLQNGELDGYKARLFVVMIGTNNTDKKTDPADVAAGNQSDPRIDPEKAATGPDSPAGYLPPGRKAQSRPRKDRRRQRTDSRNMQVVRSSTWISVQNFFSPTAPSARRS